MNKILKNFARYLDSNNLPYEFIPNKDNLMEIREPLKDSTTVLTMYISCEDDKSPGVRMHVFGLAKVNNITTELSQQLNRYNEKYSFKFMVDGSGQIVMIAVLTVVQGNEMLMSLIRLAIEEATACYPQIMRLLWK